MSGYSVILYFAFQNFSVDLSFLFLLLDIILFFRSSFLIPSVLLTAISVLVLLSLLNHPFPINGLLTVSPSSVDHPLSCFIFFSRTCFLKFLLGHDLSVQ